MLWKPMIRLTENQSITLETLRALSAISVVFAHSFQIFISGYYPQEFIYVGMIAQLSVVIFFILSGLLIGLSIQNNVHSNKGKFDLPGYAKSRILRIYPPLVFSLAITACLSIAVIYVFGIESGYKSPHKFLQGYSFLFDSKEYISTLTFTNMFTYRHVGSNGALWSLPLEVWFYVLAGLAMLKTRASSVISLCLFFLLYNSNPKFLSYSTLWFFSFFSSYFIFSKSKYGFYCFSAASLLIAATYHFLYLVETSPSYKNFYLYMVMGFVVTPVIFLIIKLNTRITIFNNLSDSSYTLYLIHFPIMLFISFLTWFYGANKKEIHIALFFVGPIATIAIAHIAGKYSENRNLALKSIGLR